MRMTKERLCELPTRWRLAGEWEHLLAIAEQGPVRTRLRVRPMTGRIRAARSEIEQLTAVLYSAEPVNPRGVARARRLVRDGAGPVYDPRSARSLVDEIGDTIAALDPSMPYGLSEDGGRRRLRIRSGRIPRSPAGRPARHRRP